VTNSLHNSLTGTACNEVLELTALFLLIQGVSLAIDPKDFFITFKVIDVIW
jgi:hypothetical protein